eukprot:TRINITY_DN810_c0_g1_i4.p1 TRINITY_DN810_c0_g1~~TRINITY_DN810_c0_g1_i4.p1  ORF type:complete len:316 (-),score=84.99 TRINITY_DN810_c0_g1_i4:175-1053(-)
MAMPFSSSKTTRRPGRLLATLAALLACWVLPSVWHSFSCPTVGLNRKQARGTIHNKDTLRPPVEVPLEEEEPESEVKPPLPERRVPYTMHIVSQFPQHKHLHEDSAAKKFIEAKLVSSLDNFETMIRHVEVHVQFSDNFHRDTPSVGDKQKGKMKEPRLADPAVFSADVDDVIESQEELAKSSADAAAGKRVVTPYIIKASVSLNNHHIINLAHPEKHAQASLQEAVDHMVDMLRKSLREEKDKTLAARKKERRNALPDDYDISLDIAGSIAEEQFEQDAKDEELYAQVEAN